MTLVDSSVWIEFLGGGNHWSRAKLRSMLTVNAPLAYLDLILLEVARGYREESQRMAIRDTIVAHTKLKPTESVVMSAARIDQETQRHGYRIRSSIDCLIAAMAMEAGATLLHKDRDFDFIAKVFPLKLEQP